jgi:DnaJ-class molecular chaperone
MADRISIKFPRFMICTACDGAGLISNYYDGSPDECRHCGATGKTMARDERGRFLPWDEIAEAENR